MSHTSIIQRGFSDGGYMVPALLLVKAVRIGYAGDVARTVAKRKPWGTIRRDSAGAAEIVALLDKQAVTIRGSKVTGRRLEDITRKGFLSDEATDDEIVALFRALDVLDYGSGKSAEDTACRLLSRCHVGTPRVRQVITTALAGMVADERTFTWDELASMKGIGPAFSRLLAACANVPPGGRVDYAGVPLTETPDQRAHSLMADIRGARRGEQPTDPDLVVDVAHQAGPNPQRYERVAMPDEVDLAETILAAIPAILHAAPQIAASASLVELATGAVLANGILRALGDPDPEVMAAKLAPIFLAMIRMMGPQGWVIGPRTERDLRVLAQAEKRPRKIDRP